MSRHFCGSRLEDNLWDLFLYHVDSGISLRFVRLASKHFYLLSHLTNSHLSIFYECLKLSPTKIKIRDTIKSVLNAMFSSYFF